MNSENTEQAARAQVHKENMTENEYFLGISDQKHL